QRCGERPLARGTRLDRRPNRSVSHTFAVLPAAIAATLPTRGGRIPDFDSHTTPDGGWGASASPWESRCRQGRGHSTPRSIRPQRKTHPGDDHVNDREGVPLARQEAALRK